MKTPETLRTNSKEVRVTLPGTDKPVETKKPVRRHEGDRIHPIHQFVVYEAPRDSEPYTPGTGDFDSARDPLETDHTAFFDRVTEQPAVVNGIYPSTRTYR